MARMARAGMAAEWKKLPGYAGLKCKTDFVFLSLNNNYLLEL